MALVRKFEKGGKKFIYENVGEYDADELASQLQLNLELYASSLGLSATNREDFIESGSRMIKAIKDGNMSKKSNGRFSVAGDYNLKNIYTDKEIKDKQEKGEVGRGAESYHGEHLKSHGIFTTLGTENFREHNHVLGLLGSYINKTLSNLSTLKDKEPEKTAYDFNTAFKDANLGGNLGLLGNWVILNNNLDSRITGVRDVFAKADYDKWALMYDQYDANLLREKFLPISNFLDLKDVEGAMKEALKYGIDLSNYFLGYYGGSVLQTPEELAAAEEEKQRLAEEARLAAYEEVIKATVLKNHPGAKGAYLESLILDVKDKEAADELQYYKNKADAKFNEAWVKSLGEVKPLAIWNLPIEQNEFLQLEEFANGGDKYTLHYDNTEFVNTLNKIRNSLLPSFNNEVSYVPKLSENQEYALKALIHLYDILKNSKDKEGKALFNSLFENISNDPKLGFILKDFKQGIKALIFKDNQLQVVDLSTIEGRPEYEKRKKSFKEEYDKIPLNKLGGILKADDGTSFSNISKYHLNQETLQASLKIEENKRKEKLQNITERADRLQLLYDFTPEGARLRLDRPMGALEIGERVTSLVADLASLGVSASSSEFGGSIPSGVLSLGGTVFNTIADHEAGMDWPSAFHNNKGSYGMDALAFAPYGKIALGYKIASKAYILGAGLLATWGAINLGKLFPEFKETFSKIGNKDQNLNAQDWQNILDVARYTLSAGATGATMVRSAKHANAFIDEKNSKVKTKDGTVVTIDKDKANALKGEKDVAEANAKFKQAQLDAGIEESAIKELPTSKLFWAKEKPRVTLYPAVKDAIYIEHPKKGVMEVNLGHVPGTGLTKTISDGLHWVTDRMSLLKPKSTIITKEQFNAKKAELEAKRKANAPSILPDEVSVELPVVNQPAPEVSLPIETNKGKGKNKKKKHLNGGSLDFTYNVLNKYYNGGIIKALKGVKLSNGLIIYIEDNDPIPEGASLIDYSTIQDTSLVKDNNIKPQAFINWGYQGYQGMNGRVWSGTGKDIAEFRDPNNPDKYIPIEDNVSADEVREYEKTDPYIRFKLSFLLDDPFTEDAYTIDNNGKILINYGESLKNKRTRALDENELGYLKSLLNVTGTKYFDNSGNLINNWLDIFKSYSFDQKNGYHHFNKPIAYTNHYFLNGDNWQQFNGEGHGAEVGRRVRDDGSIDIFYALKPNIVDNGLSAGGTDEEWTVDPNDPKVRTNKDGKRLVQNAEGKWVDELELEPGGGEVKDLDVSKNIDWTLPSEDLRVAYLNGLNTKSAEQSMDYIVPTKARRHSNYVVLGPNEILQQAESSAGTYNTVAKDHLTSSAEANTLKDFYAAALGELAKAQAVSLYTNSVRQQTAEANNLANQDQYYNIAALDADNAAIAVKSEKDADTKARNILDNAKNISSRWAARNLSQMFKLQAQEELAASAAKSNAGIEKQAAYDLYARDIKSGTNESLAYKTLQERLKAIDSKYTPMMSRIIGTNPYTYSTIMVKRGGKVSTALQSVMESAKAHNKRLLEDAKEFYKNIRKRRK